MALSRLAPLAPAVAALALVPFACGGSGAASGGSVDASTDDPSLPRHFEAAVGDEEAADAPDEYVEQAPHCVRVADAGAPTLFDAGADALPDVVALPQVETFGGQPLATPTIVSVTFPGDSLADPLDDFVASVGCTPYWRAVGADYGVGDAVASTPVRLAEAAPTTTSNPTIRAWLAKKESTRAILQFPRPAPGTIYVLWYPESTSITLQGRTSCQTFGGYHEGGALTDGTPFSYAVLPRCDGEDQTGLAQLTLAASHELIEASTDPQPDTQPGLHLPRPEPPRLVALRQRRGGGHVRALQRRRVRPAGVSLGRPAHLVEPRRVGGAVAVHPRRDARLLLRDGGPDRRGHLESRGDAPVLSGGARPGGYDRHGRRAPRQQRRVGDDAELEAVDPTIYTGEPHRLNLTLDTAAASTGATVHLAIQKVSGNPSGAEPFLLYASMNGRQTFSWGVTTTAGVI